VVKAPWGPLSRCLQGFGQLFRHRLEILQRGSLVVRHCDRLAAERTIHRQSGPLLIDYKLALTVWAFEDHIAFGDLDAGTLDPIRGIRRRSRLVVRFAHGRTLNTKLKRRSCSDVSRFCRASGSAAAVQPSPDTGGRASSISFGCCKL